MANLQKTTKKYLSFLIAFTLVLQLSGMSSLAADTKKPEVHTKVVIENLETGEISEHELGNAITRESRDSSGNKVYDYLVTVGDSNNSRTVQSTADTFGGWKGSVEITFTDDGTYACLTRAQVMWEKQSGSNTCTKVNLIYGQDLVTNAAKDSIELGEMTGIGVVTGYKPGRYTYGDGFSLGASTRATIGGNRYEIITTYAFK